VAVTATAVDIPLTPTAGDTDTALAIHTTVVLVTDLTMVDSVTMDTILPAVTVDFMAADSVMMGMVAADMTSPIPDTAHQAIAADALGHRISRTIV
jgi:hypothetical protein